MENRSLLITIDGPAGSGKTTVSKMLAQKLGYKYIDTGALYRGIAFEVKENGTDSENREVIVQLLSHIDLKFIAKDGLLRLFSGQKDITDFIRTPDMSMLASGISAKPEVREFLLDLQRQMGQEKKAVFEGRDMGTVVFPDADVKFFLKASHEERAVRRYNELAASSDQTFEEVKDDMEKRDFNDSTRAVAPLKPAEDAIYIDSTRISAKEVVEKMLAIITMSDQGKKVE